MIRTSGPITAIGSTWLRRHFSFAGTFLTRSGQTLRAVSISNAGNSSVEDGGDGSDPAAD